MSKELQTTKPERRYFQATDIHMETREGEGEGAEASPVIVGYAAVFNEQVEFASWKFREQIAEGAFSESIKEDDIRALWNHDSNHPLGRNTAGTLRLNEDSHGLRVEIDPPDTQVARDLTVSIERGDVSQMSFGFFVNKEEWESDDDWDNRTILEASLFDVSPVTFPAYPTTSVEVDSVSRALESRDAWREFNAERKDSEPMKPPSMTIDVNMELTDEARETLDRIEKAAESGALLADERNESVARLAEMKAKQAKLEDSLSMPVLQE